MFDSSQITFSPREVHPVWPPLHSATVSEHAEGTAQRVPEREGPGPAFSIVCMSSQDWANPLPTNRQQVMRRAAARGHSVLFVETGGFVGRHLLRLLCGPGRLSLARRLAVGEHVEPGMTVRKCLNLLPWGQRFAVSNRVNGWLSRLALQRACRLLATPSVTWLYDPRATWAVGAMGDAFGVYDCVDDYAEQASGSRNRALVTRADRNAASRSRLVFVTTKALRERHLATNPRTHLVGNAADFGHFAPAADRALAARSLVDLARPVLGFAGNISAAKVDLELIAALADGDSARTMLLAGPAETTLVAELRTLTRRANVVWIGEVPYRELPSVVATFDVGLIPYVENDYTRNVFPLKLFEYLAAGKPVVATGLPELGGLEPDVVVAHGYEQTEAAIASALALIGKADVERRQTLAAANTWETRTERLLSLITAELHR
jgi:glycosyltransferase involved in cell wall biosynthesis